MVIRGERDNSGQKNGGKPGELVGSWLKQRAGKGTPGRTDFYQGQIPIGRAASNTLC